VDRVAGRVTASTWKNSEDADQKLPGVMTVIFRKADLPTRLMAADWLCSRVRKTLVRMSPWRKRETWGRDARRAKSDGKSSHRPVKVLVIDLGGTNVKILVTGKRAQRKVPCGPEMTASGMVAVVKQLAADWSYDVISLGYP
jgi:hypothetical protein